MKKLICILYIVLAGIGWSQDYVLTDGLETNMCGVCGGTNCMCCMFVTLGTNTVGHGTFLYVTIAGGASNLNWTAAPSSGAMLRWTGSAWSPETDVTLIDDAWVGGGAAKGRLVYTDAATDFISVMSADFGFGTLTPNVICHIQDTGYPTLRLDRPINTVNWGAGIYFTLLDSGSAAHDYAAIYGGVEANTHGSEKGFLKFQVANPALGVAMTIASSGDTGVGIAPTEKCQVHGVIALSDTNDIPTAAAGMAKLYVTNSAAELYVIDASGNRTLLSAHDGDIPIERSENDFTGRCYWRNKWTGEEIKSWILPRDTWAAKEERENQKVEQMRAQWIIDKSAFDAWQAEEPPLTLNPEAYAAALAAWQAAAVPDPGEQPAKYTKKPTPQWVISGLEENTKINP